MPGKDIEGTRLKTFLILTDDGQEIAKKDLYACYSILGLAVAKVVLKVIFPRCVCTSLAWIAQDIEVVLPWGQFH